MERRRSSQPPSPTGLSGETEESGSAEDSFSNQPSSESTAKKDRDPSVLGLKDTTGKIEEAGEKLQAFSDNEWETGETALSTRYLNLKKDEKRVTVFSAKTGRRRALYAPESAVQRELQSKIDLIARFVSDVAKILMDDATGKEGIEVQVSLQFNTDEGLPM
ncbi:hypothetical protein GCK32_014692 [Trichostrongylus colubriformis]|uniref:Uncharacterized protein n=1 Tax=Trichostrongylus colubriformis TaxID=6319 RepID=A0AAN8ILT2_TRICO